MFQSHSLSLYLYIPARGNCTAARDDTITGLLPSISHKFKGSLSAWGYYVGLCDSVPMYRIGTSVGYSPMGWDKRKPQAERLLAQMIIDCVRERNTWSHFSIAFPGVLRSLRFLRLVVLDPHSTHCWMYDLMKIFSVVLAMAMRRNIESLRYCEDEHCLMDWGLRWPLSGRIVCLLKHSNSACQTAYRLSLLGALAELLVTRPGMKISRLDKPR